jgi:hypothetical protein
VSDLADDDAIGYRSLIAAIMEQGLHDHDRQWIDDDSPRMFGFRWCCTMLDLNAECVRATLARTVYHRYVIHHGRRQAIAQADEYVL